MRFGVRVLAWLAVTVLTGCGTYPRLGLDPARAQALEQELTRSRTGLSPEHENKILALDPANVTGRDVSEVLSRAPAPRVINLHGGLAPVVKRSISFCQFLHGMGYPMVSLTNPGDGTYTFSPYESSKKIAGVIAWHYEKEGLRPLLVGHSQGGMQAVKVLHQLACKPSSKLYVWNPLTWKKENRWKIMDPLTGQERPVAGLVLPYASSFGAGGFTRVLPNQWNMCLPWLSLHRVPGSVEEFTGFCKKMDPLGGDYLGYGPMNHYKAKDCALVRNVWLPAAYGHTTTPDTAHLLKSQQIRDWINDYRPADKSIVKLRCDEQFDADASGILWAADVWYSLKKHWVIELQRWIRAKRGVSHETARGFTASMLADQQVQIGSRKSEIGNRKSPKFMLPLRMHKQVEATDEPADGPPHSGPAPQGGKEREHSFLDEQVPLCPCVYDC